MSDKEEHPLAGAFRTADAMVQCITGIPQGSEHSLSTLLAVTPRLRVSIKIFYLDPPKDGVVALPGATVEAVGPEHFLMSVKQFDENDKAIPPAYLLVPIECMTGARPGQTGLFLCVDGEASMINIGSRLICYSVHIEGEDGDSINQVARDEIAHALFDESMKGAIKLSSEEINNAVEEGLARSYGLTSGFTGKNTKPSERINMGMVSVTEVDIREASKRAGQILAEAAAHGLHVESKDVARMEVAPFIVPGNSTNTSTPGMT